MRYLIRVDDRICNRPVKDGTPRYYYRRKFFDKGSQRTRIFSKSLGSDLRLALNDKGRWDRYTDALAGGVEPKENMTLAKFIEKYIHHISEERGLIAWKHVRGNVMAFLVYVGDRPLDKVARQDVEMYLIKRKQAGLRPHSLNGALRDIKRLFNAAVNWSYLDRSPATGIRFQRAVSAPCKLPSPEEVQRILSASPVWLRRIILTLVSTGARLGEVQGLDWSDVDFTRNLLKLRRRKVGDEILMPMTKQLSSELGELALGLGFPTKGPVFVSEIGRPFTRERLYKAFKPVVRRLGWPWLMLKTFRKVVATHIRRTTRDVRVAQKMLGHTSLRMMEYYMQDDDEARQMGANAMEGFLGNDSKDGVTKEVSQTANQDIKAIGEVQKPN